LVILIRIPSDDKTTSFYRVAPGDVLFNNTNSTEMVGKTALFEGFDEPVVFSNHFTRLRTIPSLLDPKFLSLWLLAVWKRGDFARICDRWIGQSAVQRTKLLALEMTIPDVSEQRSIAAALHAQLTQIARARENIQEQVQAAGMLSAAHLTSLFNSGLKCPWVKVGEVAEVAGGIQKTPDRNPRKFHKAFLTVRNVQRGFLDLSHIERFEVTGAEFERCRLHLGDILIVEGNGSMDHIGRNALFDQDGEWIHQNHIIRVRLPKNTFVPEFISLYLNSPAGKKQMVERAMTTTGLYTLSTS
jgi:type I restriction enzyme S subunit